MSELKVTEKVTGQLRYLLPDARSVLFFPLWDYSKSRWLAGALVWTRDDHRAFDKEELHYFKVFGSSIVSEVSRIHWTATEKSKFDFISSVSHELRSPLHGILASAELLHTTQLQPNQVEMLRMIETSGLTLLDTTNHLLDFCKISNLARTRKLRKHARKHTSSLVSDFNLGTLVEEVAEILFSGQKTPMIATDAFSKAPNDSTNTQQAHYGNAERSMIVRIEKGDTWDIQSQGGAWRRIVMNLLGNAMKWTKSGFVEISLSRARRRSEPQSRLAHLSVTDTGAGIAPDFLRHRLFSPFTQEDPLAEGVGLGLSIVRQLVASLGGDITVRSELGIGTQVDVHVPVENAGKPIRRKSSLAVPKDTLHIPSVLRACLVAFNGYPDLKETPTGMLSAEAKRKLSIQSELADVFMSQFGWVVSLAESLDKGQGDVAVIEETTLKTAIGELQSLEHLASKSRFKFFIVLSSKTSIFDHPLPSNFVRVSQPFGPRKIEKAAVKVLKIYEDELRPETMSCRSDSATDDATLLTPVAQSSITFSEKVNPLTQLDEPLPAPVPSPEGKNETTLNPGLTLSAPPSLARSASEPYQTKLAGTTSPVSALSDPSVGHVLIVDDNDINLKIMANFMRKIGCSYEMASNGLIALEKYKRSTQPYTYVLMDISMPVMDGLVSTSKIRQFE
ncbi:hypothetical protein N7492_010187 [Penicillium capsulatum]|uniref:histidine kinase n=1 Tax=Penicillium capsulatum TaxID=69766 RepID=A0A9W9HLX8_9EURO|nr:hypothetical protein N7492_010187 [Penicillium capsulatum]KAJ6112695.1 hypothetical protein N7512_008019 [Penicillium capsulatum]